MEIHHSFYRRLGNHQTQILCYQSLFLIPNYFIIAFKIPLNTLLSDSPFLHVLPPPPPAWRCCHPCLSGVSPPLRELLCPPQAPWRTTPLCLASRVSLAVGTGCGQQFSPASTSQPPFSVSSGRQKNYIVT